VFETDGEIDFTQYSRENLEKALARIDRDSYPRNYENLLKELAARGPDLAAWHAASSEATESAAAAAPNRAAYLIVVVLLTFAGVAAFTGLDTTVSMNPTFGVVIPSFVGAAVLAYVLWLLAWKHPERAANYYLDKWDVKSLGDRRALLLLSGVVSAMFLAYVTRDAESTIGVALGGKTHVVEATVLRTRAPNRSRCEVMAVFQLENLDTVEICVRHHTRAKLIDSKLVIGERVGLGVLKV
jgi:hypothetical protein